MRKILKVITALFLTLAFVVILVFNLVLNDSPLNLNKQYIPSDAAFVAKFDVQELFIHTIRTLLISKDKSLIKQSDKVFNDLSENRVDGINYNSDIYFFVKPYKGDLIEGTLYNLINASDFSSYCQEHSDEFVSASNNDVGLIIKHKTKYSEAELNKLATEIISKKENEKSLIKFDDNKGTLISTWSKLNTNFGSLYGSLLKLEMYNHEIKIAGKISIDSGIEINQSSKTLKKNKKGFHFTSKLFPKGVKDSIITYLGLHDLGPDIPDFIAISGNYSGLEIKQESNTEFIPDIELLLEFKDSINVNRLLEKLVLKNKISRIGNSEINIQGLKLFVHQLTDKSIYINQNIEAKPVLESSNSLLLVEGSPFILFAIKDNSGISKLFNLLPTYAISKRFAKGIKKIKFEFKPSKDNLGILNGRIQFSNESYAIIEILKLLNTLAPSS